MSTETTIPENKKDIAAEFDVVEKGKELAEETLEELNEKRKSTTPKTGKPTKDAKDAENILILAGGLETIVTGVNAIISSKIPEFKHEPEEIKTISTLTAPVAAKYFDLDSIAYKEEIKLLSYLFMCEMQKVEAFTARLRREAAEKKEKSEKRKSDDTKKG